jgi:hypothetical protein
MNGKFNLIAADYEHYIHRFFKPSERTWQAHPGAACITYGYI